MHRRIPLPGFQEWGVGAQEAVPTAKLCAALGFKHGVVTTSNSLDQTEVMKSSDSA
jgi:5'-methylthioadenosine nucleosidase